MLLNTGTLLQGGKYRIIRALGQGGFGITYEAEQQLLRRKVAIKEFFMKDCCERDSTTSRVTIGTGNQKELVEKFRGKFIREAQVIAGMENPHIVRVMDVFEENGTAYYVMENLTGGSLADKVKKGGPLSEAEAEKYIRQVADALAYIHSLNTVHLDVKPSNILLNAKGDAVLIDFGISKHYDDSGEQTSSTPVGISKGYAPLEQNRDGDVSQFKPSTDIYSLGATLYYLVSGSIPPEATIVNEDGIDRLKGLSDRLWKTIETSMQPRRKDRPQNIPEFLSLLNDSLGGISAKDDEATVISTPISSISTYKKNPKKDKRSEINKLKSIVTNKKFQRIGIASLSFILLAGIIILFLHNPYYSKAEKKYRKDAESGNAEAQFNLANCYEQGDGVKQNYVDAAFWYSKAAEQDYPMALFSIGLLNYYGLGVAQNYSHAFTFFKRASNHGIANANYYLGVCYEKGLGVEPDKEDALRWYQLALTSSANEDLRTDAEKALRRLELASSEGGTNSSNKETTSNRTISNNNNTSSSKVANTTTTSGSTTTRSNSAQTVSSTSPSSLSKEVNINEKVQLSISNATVTKWESDNESIAKVSSSGVVTGVSSGKTYVWAHLNNGRVQMFIIVVPSPSSTNSRTREITGTITSTTGKPFVSDVLIRNSKTKVETKADSNGFYHIQASEGDVLVFSNESHKSVRVTVGKHNTIQVVMFHW